MEQDDEEFEQLLGEIPRATSAPPHLEELQKAYGGELSNSPFVASLREDSSLPPVKPFIDIRCDEQYENFYRAYSGVKKLPLPMENRTLYSDFPSLLSPKSNANHLSPFFSGLALDSPRTMAGLRPRHKQEQISSQIANINNSANNLGRTSSPPSDHHPNSVLSAEDRSLSSAFGNLSFEESPNNSMMGGRLREDNVAIGENRAGSKGGLDHGLVSGNSLPNGRGPVSSNGLYSHLSNTFSTGFGSDSAAALEAFVNMTPSSTMELFPQKGAASPAMEPANNGSFPGLEDFSSGQVAQVYEKYIRRGSPPDLDNHSYSSGARQGGGVMLDGFGTNNGSHVSHQQLDAYAAASAAARMIHPGMPSPSINGSELYSSNNENYNYASLRALQQHAQRLLQMDAEDKLRHRQAQHLIQQQQTQQLRFFASLQAQANASANGSVSGFFGSSLGHSPTGSSARQSSLQPISTNQVKNQRNGDGMWNVNLQGAVMGQNNGEPARGSLANSICRYYAQGYCSRGDTCPFSHSQGFGGSARASPASNFKEATREERMAMEKILNPKRANGRTAGPAMVAGSLPRRKPEVLSNGNTPHMNGHSYVNGNHAPHVGFHGDMQSLLHGDHSLLEYEATRQIVGPQHLPQQNQQPKYNTLEEVEGRIFSIAKDQHGCRFLQRKFDEGGPEDVQKIFQEIIDHIIELMTDPFGNYLVQKLLEVCDEHQRMEILHVVTGKGELVQISLNMHGTRAVQKLIETLKSPEQVAMVISSLKQGVVTLIKDLNGNHVVQRCLQRLSTEDSQFIFDAAAVHCVEIATHRHGCCVLQRCVDFASGPQRQRLVAEIASNALVLSQDPFGNYVVQYILDLGMPWASVEVMVRLENNYPFLAMQKFSSNVVEKCLKQPVEENRTHIVRELIASPRLGQMLQDPYANYVVQSALTVAKGSLHSGLVDAIRPHLSVLRSSPYGKRILSRTNLKK